MIGSLARQAHSRLASRTDAEPRSGGLFLLGALAGGVLVAVPLSAIVFILGGGISSPPGSVTALASGAFAGLQGGLLVAGVCAPFGLLAGRLIEGSPFPNPVRGLIVGIASAGPLWVLGALSPSVPVLSLAVLIAGLFGVASTGRWRGGFARR